MAKLIFLLFFPSIAFSQRFVIIHFFDQNPWTLGIEKGVMQELTVSGYSFQKKTIFMHGRSLESILGETKEFQADFVILNDDGASEALIPIFLKENIPIFCVGITEDPNDIWWNKPKFEDRISSIFQSAQFVEAVVFLEKFKDIKTIGILGGDSFATKNLAKKAQNQLSQKYQVHLNHQHFLDLWEKNLFDLDQKSDALIVFLPFDVFDQKGNHVSWDKVSKILLRIKNPIIGLSRFKKTDPIKRMISHSICPEKQGKHLASLIFKFLKTKKMPMSEVFRFQEIQINEAEVNRLGLKIPNEIIGLVSLE